MHVWCHTNGCPGRLHTSSTHAEVQQATCGLINIALPIALPSPAARNSISYREERPADAPGSTDARRRCAMYICPAGAPRGCATHMHLADVPRRCTPQMCHADAIPRLQMCHVDLPCRCRTQMSPANVPRRCASQMHHADVAHRCAMQGVVRLGEG